MKKYKKKIFAYTSTRADYGLQRNLFNRINSEIFCDFNLVVLGTHFFKKFGSTYNEIKKDKFKKVYEIRLPLNLFLNNNSKSFSTIFNKSSILLNKKKPDYIILLGDRLEIMSIALSAFILKIPIIHISGGEKTIGSNDDIYRHTISKVSNLHLVSEKPYLKRLIQIGENRNTIHVVGSLASNNISKLTLKPKNIILNELNIDNDKKIFLINYHPTNETIKSRGKDFQNLLNAVSKFNHVNLVFTSPNADTGYKIIKDKIDKFVMNHSNAIFIPSLGNENYYSLLKYTKLVIGNSSSGITEAPLFKVISINVGNRQQGRLLNKSIINVNTSEVSILKGIIKGLKSKNNFNNTYFKKKNAINNIINILKTKTYFNVNEHKEFIDIKF